MAHYLMMIAYALTASGGLALIKIGSKSGALISFVNNRLELNVTVHSIIGIVLYVASFLLYLYLISKFDLSYIIPLSTALVYIFIFAFAVTIFGESLTLIKTLAIILILIGVFILNITGK